MATQLGATPTLYGKEARRVLKESRKKPSQQSADGMEILKAMFDGKTKAWL